MKQISFVLPRGHSFMASAKKVKKFRTPGPYPNHPSLV